MYGGHYTACAKTVSLDIESSMPLSSLNSSEPISSYTKEKPLIEELRLYNIPSEVFSMEFCNPALTQATLDSTKPKWFRFDDEFVAEVPSNQLYPSLVSGKPFHACIIIYIWPLVWMLFPFLLTLPCYYFDDEASIIFNNKIIQARQCLYIIILIFVIIIIIFIYIPPTSRCCWKTPPICCFTEGSAWINHFSSAICEFIHTNRPVDTHMIHPYFSLHYIIHSSHPVRVRVVI